MNMRHKVRAIVCMAVVALACMTGSPAAKAQVVATGALCTGLGTQTYVPAISNNPRNTDFHGTGVFSCASTSLPAMVGGTFSVTGNGVFSCLGATSFIGTLHLNWTDESGNVIATSEAPMNTLGVNVPVGSLLATRGVIGSGPFESANATVILPGLPLQPLGCLIGSGISNTGAPLFLGISSAI